MLHGALWSVRNKLTDILKAKSLTEAQMYAHELDMRLQHLENAINEVEAHIRDGICTVPGHTK